MAEPRLRVGGIGSPEGVALEDETGAEVLRVSGGAAVAPIMDRGGEKFNVKVFGAKGDGVTDDTDAFHEALQTGRPIFVPEGTYIVTGLEWEDGVSMVGEGYKSVIRLAPGLLTARPLLYAHDCHNFVLRDLHFDANREAIGEGALRNAGQPWEGLSLSECSGVSVYRVWVRGADNEGIDIDGGEDINISSATIMDCGGAGIHPSHGTGALVNFGVRVSNLVSRNNGHTYNRGAVYSLDGEFAVIENVRSHNDYAAVQVGGSRRCDIVIRGVEAINTADHSVRIYAGSTAVDIDGLYSEGSGGAGLWVDGAGDNRRSHWSRVRVVNPASFGVRVAGSNWTLSDVEVVNPGDNGITTVTGAAGRIVRPVVRGETGLRSGIFVAADGIQILDPDVSGFQYGINASSVTDVECFGGILTGNEVGYNMTGASVSARHRLVGVNVQGNSVQGLRRVGTNHSIVACQGAPAAGSPDTHTGWFVLGVEAGVTAGIPLERYTDTYPMEWVADRDCVLTQIFVQSSEPRTSGSLTVQVEINEAVVPGFSAQLTVTYPQVRRSEVGIAVSEGDRVRLRYQTTPDFAPDGTANITAGFVVE